MLEKAIPDMIRARLHKYRVKLELNSKMLIPEFIAVNKAVLNDIYRELKKEYPELDGKRHKLLIEQGILNYVMACGTEYK